MILFEFDHEDMSNPLMVILMITHYFHNLSDLLVTIYKETKCKFDF